MNDNSGEQALERAIRHALQAPALHIFVDPEGRFVEANFENSMVTDNILEYLKNLNALHHLLLRFTLVTDKIMEIFEVHPEIRKLDISETLITDAGIKHFKFATSLELLFLGQKITDNAVDHIKGLQRLEILDIIDTSITARGLCELATTLPNLNFLWLSKAQVSDESIQCLKNAKHLKKLTLALADDTDPVFIRLQQSLPGIEMVW